MPTMSLLMIAAAALQAGADIDLPTGAHGSVVTVESVNMGSVLNTPETHETTPYVAPDGSYIIFGSRGRPDSFGDLDLYITVRDSAGQWSAPRNLGPGINSTAGELCPIVSPDGRYLYFTSTRGFIGTEPGDTAGGRDLKRRLRNPGNGLGDTYRVPLAPVLEAMGVRDQQARGERAK